MSEKGKIKVLVAKPGLDGHDRGAKVITMGLREAGMEVIYTGLRQSPEMIARAALEEQPDAVALSCLSGAHQSLFPRVVDELRKRDMNDILVIGGGIVPDEDVPYLKEKGISEVFGPGTSIKELSEYIREHV